MVTVILKWQVSYCQARQLDGPAQVVAESAALDVLDNGGPSNKCRTLHLVRHGIVLIGLAIVAEGLMFLLQPLGQPDTRLPVTTLLIYFAVHFS